ncbi:membrane-associated protein, putative, partial [Bodo saltans]
GKVGSFYRSMRKTVAPMQGVGAAFLYGCLLLLLLHQEVVVGVTAQYLSTAELSSQSVTMRKGPSCRCHRLRGQPPIGHNTLGASVYTSSIESPNLKLRCLEVFFDRSPTINESYAATCLSYSWKINVCVVNVATGVESCNLTMNNAFIYNSSSRPASWSAGDTYFSQGFNSQLRIRWLPNATMPVSCYPMYFTTVAVVENNSPGSTSSLATVIIFVAIAGVVLVILLFFGRYQLRKVLSKFGKKVSTKPRKSEFDGIERDVPTAHGNYYDDEQQDMKAVGVPMDDETEEDFRQRYGVHAIRSHGRQQAELIDGVKVTARPMIQPWYERNSFISPNANRKGGVERYATQPPQQQANGAAPIAMQVAHILGPDGGGS